MHDLMNDSNKFIRATSTPIIAYTKHTSLRNMLVKAQLPPKADGPSTAHTIPVHNSGKDHIHSNYPLTYLKGARMSQCAMQ